jgi:hypothetical protein
MEDAKATPFALPFVDFCRHFGCPFLATDPHCATSFRNVERGPGFSLRNIISQPENANPKYAAYFATAARTTLRTASWAWLKTATCNGGIVARGCCCCHPVELPLAL